MRVLVQHAGTTHALDLADRTSADDVRTALVEATGVLARNQKLVFKGKVLVGPGQEATATKPLADLGVPDGAKLLLLATAPTAGGVAAAAAAARAEEAAKARRAAAGPESSGGGSSGGVTGNETTLAARAAGWARTGVVCLRAEALTSLPAEVWGEAATAARAVDASANPGLEALPPDVSRFARVARLRLSGCGLTAAGFPPEFAALTSLSALWLDGNQLTEVPPCVANLPTLRALNLAGNRLAALPDCLPVALEALDVSNNALTALPAGLGACARLAALDAAGNQVGSLPPALSALGRLQSLRLDDNRIEAVPPEILKHCSSLVSLSLKANPITLEALRATNGWAAHDARRTAAVGKRLAGRTGTDFDEGADPQRWLAWASQGRGVGGEGRTNGEGGR